ncbi:MAG: outer membrane lipid asymmetry maintenance protein MlaD [Myxococcota bacterium]
MQNHATRDVIVGLFVLVGLATLAYLSLQVGGIDFGAAKRIHLSATFDDIGGLSVRAPVRIGGVKIGQVSAIGLDADSRPKVTLDVDADVAISTDSTAAIRTAGLLGDQFISVELGAEDANLADGEAFEFTESAFSIDKLVGHFIHNAGVSD